MLQQTPSDPTSIDVDSILRDGAAAANFIEGPLSITSLLGHMAIGLVLALVLQWHFRRFASTLSNREAFSKVFPFILLTTLLIIMVVKSSLALSLGLVGALSIVRFRTPIKEPEELGYLFICIAIGLGLGAEQTLPTIAGATFIIVIASLIGLRTRRRENKNLYLSVNWAGTAGDRGLTLDALNELLGQHVMRSDLRRVDSRDGSLEASYLVELASASDLSKLIDHLHEANENVEVSFVDQGRLPTA